MRGHNRVHVIWSNEFFIGFFNLKFLKYKVNEIHFTLNVIGNKLDILIETKLTYEFIVFEIFGRIQL